MSRRRTNRRSDFDPGLMRNYSSQNYLGSYAYMNPHNYRNQQFTYNSFRQHGGGPGKILGDRGRHFQHGRIYNYKRKTHWRSNIPFQNYNNSSSMDQREDVQRIQRIDSRKWMRMQNSYDSRRRPHYNNKYSAARMSNEDKTYGSPERITTLTISSDSSGSDEEATVPRSTITSEEGVIEVKVLACLFCSVISLDKEHLLSRSHHKNYRRHLKEPEKRRRETFKGDFTIDELVAYYKRFNKEGDIDESHLE